MRVSMIAAITADGHIGRTRQHLSLDWTAAEDKKLFVEVTKAAGVMVFGSTTFDTIGRALPGRRTIVYTSRPDQYQQAGIETTTLPPRQLVAQLGAEGTTGLAVCGGAAIYDAFMRSGVVDELYLTVEPVLFGSGVRLFRSELQVDLGLIEQRLLNAHTLLLHYAVQSVQAPPKALP